jgi:hypothetical protein
VEAGVRRVTSQLPGVLVGAFLSLVVSVVVLFVQHSLREHGELRREAAWTRGGFSRGESERREFEVRFYNERDVTVALWDIRLEVYEEGKLTAKVVPEFADDLGRGLVDVLNLPSRVGIVRRMGVTVERQTIEEVREALRPLREAENVVLVGVMPGGEEVRTQLGQGAS